MARKHGGGWWKGWYCDLVHVTWLLSHVFYFLITVSCLFWVGLFSQSSWHTLLVFQLAFSAYIKISSIGCFLDIWFTFERLNEKSNVLSFWNKRNATNIWIISWAPTYISVPVNNYSQDPHVLALALNQTFTAL